MKSAHVRIGVRDGRCVSIDDVPSGLACNCVCAACQRPLVARKGSQRTHHFAHRPGDDCERAGETTLHRAAKQLLVERRQLWLPEFRGTSTTWLTESMQWAPMWSQCRDWITGTIYEAQLVVADKVDVEVALGEVRADVVVVTGDGRELLVEIRVTHAVDEEKRDRIHARGRACVEIDLSSVPRDVTLCNLASMVVGGGEDAAPRRWISCPKGDREVERRNAAMKQKFMHAVRRARRRLDVGGFYRDVVKGCPIKVYKGQNQERMIDCIYCPHHVAYFDDPDRDGALHADITGVSEFAVVYCDHPRRARALAPYTGVSGAVREAGAEHGKC